VGLVPGDAQPSEGGGGLLAGEAQLPGRRNARNVTVPAVFVITGRDTVVPVKYQTKVEAAYRGEKRYVRMPDSEHNASLEGVAATDVAAAGGQDELDLLAQGGNFGTGNGAVPPVVTVPAGQGGLGGCAVTGRTVFAGALDGQKLDVLKLTGAGRLDGTPTDVLTGRYGRLRTTVLDAGGGLWLTTSNRDGIGKPAADDDKVLRIVPPSSSGGSPL